MVADLITSNLADAPAVIDAVGWRWIWDDLSGGDLRRVVDQAGPVYWAKKSLEAKKHEVKFLADGRTDDISQRAIIVILTTCASPTEPDRGTRHRQLRRLAGARLRPHRHPPVRIRRAETMTRAA